MNPTDSFLRGVKIARLTLVHEGKKYALQEIVTLELYNDYPIRLRIEEHLQNRFAAIFRAEVGWYPSEMPMVEWADETLRLVDEPAKLEKATARKPTTRTKRESGPGE